MSDLSQLSLSTEGIAFDPATGDTFVANETGVMILKAIQAGKPTHEIVRSLTDRFQVTAADAERDVVDFQSRLRVLGLT